MNTENAMTLVIGRNGQLAREMQRKLKAASRPFFALGSRDIDIASERSICAMLDSIQPCVVINCAAYTNVDKAENEEEVAYRINALGPKYLAEQCQQRDIELVHISTDYVFSGEPILDGGSPRPYRESDPCMPATAYGRTKLAGERFVQEKCDKYYILRTAWLYGDGNNFVRTMLRLAQESPFVRIVNDQIGTPTSTTELSGAILSLIGSSKYGLYHATCEGQCSWYDFALQIFSESGIKTPIIPVSSKEFPRPAPRPKWSVLENAALNKLGKNSFRPWQEVLKDYLRQEIVNREEKV